MTSRLRASWRLVGIPHGFAVDDATGRQWEFSTRSGSVQQTTSAQVSLTPPSSRQAASFA
jgi:hypothetical protein